MGDAQSSWMEKKALNEDSDVVKTPL